MPKWAQIYIEGLIVLAWLSSTAWIFHLHPMTRVVVATPAAMLTEWLAPASVLPTSFSVLEALSKGRCLGKEVVFNQGECGACLAFATATAFGMRACLQGGATFANHVPSPFRLFDCAGGDCARNTGLNAQGVMRVMVQHGVPLLTEAAATFGQGCPQQQQQANQSTLKVQRYQYVCGRQPIKREVMERGPGVLSMRVSESAMQDEAKVREGRLEHGLSLADTHHALVLLGWLDEQDTWLVQNSWSSSWGVQGVGTVPQSLFDCVLVFEPSLIAH